MTTPVTRELLQQRTRKLAVEAIRLIGDLPRTPPADIIGRQLVRSATSVAANYRSACRARWRRDCIAEMGVVEEEADETAFWLELLDECGLAPATRLVPLSREAGELLAITVASIRTARMDATVIARSSPASRDNGTSRVAGARPHSSRSSSQNAVSSASSSTTPISAMQSRRHRARH